MSTPQLSRVRVQRIAEEAVERARLRVVPRTRVRAPRVPFVMLVSAILLAGVVGLLLFNTTMQQNSFAAADLQTQADELRSQEQALQAELDELKDPQVLASKAQDLGMVYPVCPRFLFTGTGKITRACDEPAQALQVDPPAPVRPDELVPERTVVKVKATDTTKPTDTPKGDAKKAPAVRSNGGTARN